MKKIVLCIIALLLTGCVSEKQLIKNMEVDQRDIGSITWNLIDGSRMFNNYVGESNVKIKGSIPEFGDEFDGIEYTSTHTVVDYNSMTEGTSNYDGFEDYKVYGKHFLVGDTHLYFDDNYSVFMQQTLPEAFARYIYFAEKSDPIVVDKVAYNTVRYEANIKNTKEVLGIRLPGKLKEGKENTKFYITYAYDKNDSFVYYEVDLKDAVNEAYGLSLEEFTVQSRIDYKDSSELHVSRNWINDIEMTDRSYINFLSDNTRDIRYNLDVDFDGPVTFTVKGNGMVDGYITYAKIEKFIPELLRSDEYYSRYNKLAFNKRLGEEWRLSSGYYVVFDSELIKKLMYGSDSKVNYKSIFDMYDNVENDLVEWKEGTYTYSFHYNKENTNYFDLRNYYILSNLDEYDVEIVYDKGKDRITSVTVTTDELFWEANILGKTLYEIVEPDGLPKI